MLDFTFPCRSGAVFVLSAFALAGCGGSAEIVAPFPSLPPQPQADIACTPIRIFPSNNTVGIHQNTLIAVMYQARSHQRCEAPALTDANGKKLDSNMLLHHEWPLPGGGFAGTFVVEASGSLAASSKHQIVLSNTTIGTFHTASGDARRGQLVSSAEQNLAISELAPTSLLAPETINSLLYRMADALVGEKVLADTFYELVKHESPNIAKPNARYAARIKKVVYSSSRADGTPITLSGLLVYPENVDGTPFDYSTSKLVLNQHGAIDSMKPAPSSAATSEALLGVIVAGKGHIYFLPDLIGLGDTASSPQAYLVAHDTATATLDMLAAVRNYFKTTYASLLGNRLVLSGASQGAYSALAALPYVARDNNVIGVYGLAGPYNVYQTLTSSLLAVKDPAKRDKYSEFENLAFVPGHLHSILQSYRDTQGLNYIEREVLDGEGKWQSAFLATYTVDKYPEWTLHLGINTLINSTMAYSAPNAHVALFHHTGDTLVPPQNTTDLVLSLKDARHRFSMVERSSCHEQSLYMKAFLELKKNPLATHRACGIYYIDRIIGDL